jgi:spore coat protein U-like protein
MDSVWNYYFGNLLSLNVWLFIHLFYLVGHWGNWSLQLYHNLFAITGQFDKFSFCCIIHIMVNSTVSIVQSLQKLAFGLHCQMDQTINLISVSNISCIENSTLQFSVNLSN